MKTLCLFVLAAVGSMVSGLAQEYEVASKPLRVKFDAKDIAAPSIFLTYKNSGVVNAQGKVDVDIRILDESGIRGVSINEENLDGELKDSLVYSRSFLANEEVSVMARDNFNNVKEKSFTVKAQTSVVVTETSKHRFHALLIGIDEYQDPQVPHLTEPIKDATLLKNVLVNKYTFEETDVTLLKNPTYEDLSVAFEDLSRKVGPTDFLLIFYAGHGYFDVRTNIGYWWPSDAVQKNTAKWFRNSALVENIGAINSKHTLLIADACFSGGIFKTRAVELNNNANSDISYKMRKVSRKAMTSGSLTTVPDKSVFMRYLLKTLSENSNEFLPSEDLFDDIRLAMKNNSTTRPLYGEIQNVGDEGGDFVLIRKKE